MHPHCIGQSKSYGQVQDQWVRQPYPACSSALQGYLAKAGREWKGWEQKSNQVSFWNIFVMEHQVILERPMCERAIENQGWSSWLNEGRCAPGICWWPVHGGSLLQWPPHQWPWKNIKMKLLRVKGSSINDYAKAVGNLNWTELGKVRHMILYPFVV